MSILISCIWAIFCVLYFESAREAIFFSFAVPFGGLIYLLEYEG